MYSENQKAGDELIERKAKELITSGMHHVTRNMAAFAYLFGNKELGKLEKHAFDYAYKKFEILGLREYHRNHFNDVVYMHMDRMALKFIDVYNTITESQRKKIELVYSSGSELEQSILEELKGQLPKR